MLTIYNETVDNLKVYEGDNEYIVESNTSHTLDTIKDIRIISELYGEVIVTFCENLYDLRRGVKSTGNLVGVLSEDESEIRIVSYGKAKFSNKNESDEKEELLREFITFKQQFEFFKKEVYARLDDISDQIRRI